MNGLSVAELDRFAGQAARSTILIGGMIAVLTAVGLTVAHWSEVVYPAAAAIGVLLVAASVLLAYDGTAPHRPTFTQERFGLVVATAVAAAFAEYLSTIGAKVYVANDYGPVVVGIVILLLAPYCSWLSLVSGGLVSAFVLAFLLLGTAERAGEFAVLPVASAVTILLAMTAGAAAYSWGAVSEILEAQREVNRAMLDHDAEVRSGVSPHSRRSPVSVLARQVLPFLARVMTAERITVADADRARELADALRHALRSGFRSTWLDELGGDLEEAHGVAVQVVDREGAATRLSTEQRVMVAGFLTWLSESDRSSALRVVLSRSDAPATQSRDRGVGVRARDGRVGRLVITSFAGEGELDRAAIERFIPLAPVVRFEVVAVDVGENVRVEFHYDLD
ncbi:hypothetical protein ACDF64_10165 [Agromyces sp. MMS24-JH15]|uniref:hypothetical protein n=1 Tax=Agromyces sp. MMS24-JH15 TaxID=3243765 RepID=UPI003749EEF4